MQLPTGTVGGFGVRVYPAEGLSCMNHEVKNSSTVDHVKMFSKVLIISLCDC